MVKNFHNVRFSITESIQLSQSGWVENGREYRAVALLVKQGTTWVVNSETAVEGSANLSDDRQVCHLAYWASQKGIELAKSILGAAMPERFYRDNQIL